ncbi:Zinc finger protein neuro-d4 [Frankliniella fusca]|uniref:Zinc finger protein neuro-d4 n=1 Tax=Frankliniella fusca TaxID=407009 RepID=A0AAE1HD22_9NEOP|nr:Zinc finger protein neuro-d4 [Frankliniella fusca]
MMASCATEPTGSSLLEKIESFLNDSQYRETVESSVNYNTRLCIERRLRMPFLDSQTGVAQNHSNLFMTSRQRLPGFLQGQIYTYPSKRWRKRRRQYLSHFLQPRRGTVMPAKEAGDEAGEHFHTISTVENPAAVSVNDEASKDSIKEDPKEWYINEDDIYDMDGFDEPDPDSDYDYEESYRKKKKRNSKPTRGASTDSPHNKKAKPVGRGRKKNPTVYPDPSDPDKPFGCDICGARYKTRPGLTYHFTHSHKNKDHDEEEASSAGPGTALSSAMGGPGSASGSPSSVANVSQGAGGGPGGPGGPVGDSPLQPPTTPGSASNGDPQKGHSTDGPGSAAWSKFQDSYLSFLKSPEGSPKKTKGAPGIKSTPSSAGHSRPTTPASEEADPSAERKMGAEHEDDPDSTFTFNSSLLVYFNL